MKVLCTGDLHLGRRSSKVPAWLDGADFSCSAAWLALVECAIERDVDLVAISGDIVDRDNRYFEAFGPLEHGLRRLGKDNIPVVAVAGNHDFDVLPRLVATVGLEHVHLLGYPGRWERWTLEHDGRPALHVDGWSFPAEHVRYNPLSGYQPSPSEDAPVLAILHADLDQPRSAYGPVSLANLQRMPVAMWLLGHIHSAALHESPGCPPVLYPGSPQAMDPGESGTHGAWLVAFDPGQPPEASLIPLSTVYYSPLTVDLTGVHERAALDSALVEAVRRELARAAGGDSGRLRCLSCRVTLTGRTALHGKLRSLVETVRDDLALTAGEITAVIDRVDIDTRPAVELDRLAAASDPVGEIARLLLALDGTADPPGEYRDLLARTLDGLRMVHRASAYRQIGLDPEPDPDAARKHLVAQAWLLLDALLQQREVT